MPDSNPPHNQPTPPEASAPTRVEVRGDVVVKTQAPAHAALELEKSEAGRAVGEASGRFTVPRILDADLARGSLVFERIVGLRPVRALLAEAEWTTWCDAAAHALAAVHASLALDEGRRRPVGVARPDDGEPVWLHGDYSPTNVQVQTHTGRLWVLDWLGPGWLDPEATIGPPAHDLACFVLPLFWQRPRDPLGVPEPEARSKRFLDAYGQVGAMDPAAVARVGGALQRARLPHAAGLVRPSGVLARLPWQLRCWHFLRQLSGEGGPAANAERHL